MDKNDVKLSPEDQQRVNEYLCSGVNKVKRTPFKPLKLGLVLLVVVIVLGVFSRIIGTLFLPY